MKEVWNYDWKLIKKLFWCTNEKTLNRDSNRDFFKYGKHYHFHGTKNL